LDEAAGVCGGRGGLYKYYGMGIQWPFRHLIALRPRELPILLKREFMHRRILSPAVELLHHPTQTAAPEHAIASAAPAASSKSPLHSEPLGQAIRDRSWCNRVLNEVAGATDATREAGSRSC